VLNKIYRILFCGQLLFQDTDTIIPRHNLLASTGSSISGVCEVDLVYSQVLAV